MVLEAYPMCIITGCRFYYARCAFQHISEARGIAVDDFSARCRMFRSQYNIARVSQFRYQNHILRPLSASRIASRPFHREVILLWDLIDTAKPGEEVVSSIDYN